MELHTRCWVRVDTHRLLRRAAIAGWSCLLRRPQGRTFSNKLTPTTQAPTTTTTPSTPASPGGRIIDLTAAEALLTTALGCRLAATAATPLAPAPSAPAPHTVLLSPAGRRASGWRYGARAFGRAAQDARRDAAALAAALSASAAGADADADAIRALAAECASLDDAELATSVRAAVDAAAALRGRTASRTARAAATRLLFGLTRCARLVAAPAPAWSGDGGDNAQLGTAPRDHGLRAASAALARAATLPPPPRHESAAARWPSFDGASAASDDDDGATPKLRVATALAAALDAAAASPRRSSLAARVRRLDLSSPSSPSSPATPDATPPPARTVAATAHPHRLSAQTGPDAGGDRARGASPVSDDGRVVAPPSPFAAASPTTTTTLVCRICDAPVPAPGLREHTEACAAAVRAAASYRPPPLRKGGGATPAAAAPPLVHPSPDRPPPPPPTIADFHLVKPISRGAYGRVYLARKRATGDVYAVKAMRKADLVRRNAAATARAERDALAAAACPFVIASYYAFTSPDCVYIVMEYAPGGDLASLLAVVGALDEPAARAATADAVLALEFCHAAGVVHRDVKPDNLLVAGDGRVKLADFGLSTAGVADRAADAGLGGGGGSDNAPPPPDASPSARPPPCVGTPDYLAPELLLGTGHGPAADWWSLGATLFELLTGAPPFAGPTPEAVFDAALSRRIAWPPAGTLSDASTDLIDRLLDPDPSTRLGAVPNGAAAVKAHPWFTSLDWAAAASAKAPPLFVPRLDGKEDTSYFADVAISKPVSSTSAAVDAAGDAAAVAAALAARGGGGAGGALRARAAVHPGDSDVEEDDDDDDDATTITPDAVAAADAVHFSDFAFTNVDTLGAANAAALAELGRGVVE